MKTPQSHFAFFAYFASLIVLLFCCDRASGQGESADPLARTRDILTSEEIVLVWSQGPVSTARQKIYDLSLQGNVFQLDPKPAQTEGEIAGNKKLAVAAGNFSGGPYKHFVTAWAGPGDSIKIAVPWIDADSLSWADASRLTVPGPLKSVSGSINTKIHLVAGDFFGDNRDEFVLGYEGADTAIHLQVFSFDSGSLDPQAMGEIHDQRIFLASSPLLDNWDIAAGDFDGDGRDEIALALVTPAPAASWDMTVAIYSIDDLGNPVAQGSAVVFPKPAYTVGELNVVVTAGDFDIYADDEIALGFCFYQGDQPGNDTYLYLVDVQDGLNALAFNDGRRAALNAVSVNQIEPLSIASGDMDGLGRDEIAFGIGSNVNIYAVNDTLLPLFQDQLSGFTDNSDINRYSDDYLAVGDMDRDGEAEIVVVKNIYIRDNNETQRFEVKVYAMLDSSLTQFTLKTSALNDEPTPDGSEGLIRHYAVAMGDFKGDRLRIGDPVHYRKTGVQHITVVVNSPPVHYDVFEPDTTRHDLSGCYPGQACGFSSTYIQTSTAETTVTEEVHDDWGVDATLGAGGEIYGVKLEAKLTASYGEGFARVAGSTSSYKISIGRLAAGDDWVYAMVVDYDLYEYPVYDSLDPVPIGYVLAVIAGQAQPIWIEAKDDPVIGNSFRPNHEVGNVLSYENTTSDQLDKLIIEMDDQTIGGTGSSFDELEISDFALNSVETSWNVGVEVSASAEFGIQIEGKAKYTQKNISTIKTNVGESLTVRGDFGHLASAYSVTGSYHVVPYAYWAKNGALVLDYKVPPFPLDPGSFWNTRYGGKSDLAFNLPWRLDPEKGLPLPGVDSSYRRRSHDVTISRKDPNPGDTMTVGARFRNFGLQDIASPVTVRFFKGDPDAGGEQIGEVIDSGGIAARGSRSVYFTWIPPIGTPRTTRIYAVLDPDNTFPGEIHENNNAGWTTLSDYAIITDVPEVGELPSSFRLYEAYPNPFNPSSTIRYDLPRIARVTLKVYNVLGQEIATLVDELQAAGRRETVFDGAGLPSGVYFYRLQAGEFAGVKKFMLVK